MVGIAFVDTAARNRPYNEFFHKTDMLRYVRQPKIIVLMDNSG
jgi:hypothetical protein